MATKNKTAEEIDTKSLPVDGASFLPEDDKVEQLLGFPAYWAPSKTPNAKGNHGVFFATLVGNDDSDPDFERWIFTAKHPILCHRGPVGEQEPVVVQPGQFFSVAKAVQLRLQKYMGFDVQLTAVRKDDIGGGQTMWVYKLDTDKETAKRLAERDASIVRAQLEGKTAKQLNAST